MNHLPDVWGSGNLFAYSGIDGPTSWAHSLVGSTRADPPGIVFPLQNASLTLGNGMRIDRVRLAGSDVADLDLVDGTGARIALRLACLDRLTIVGQATAPLDVSLQGQQGPLILVTGPAGARFRFALSLALDGHDLAHNLARDALDLDIDALCERRQAFFTDRLPAPPPQIAADERLARLYAKACAVLKVNVMRPEGAITHLWSTPDRWPHRDMWLWDSAFHAPAYARLDPALGQETLLAVLEMQREDGFIAHQMSPQRTSSITQPPVLAWSCRQVYDVSGDTVFLDQAYPALCAYLEWDLEHRDWNGDGLLGWLIEGNPLCRSGESGMDNSPRFDPDGPWDNVDFCAYMVSDMRAVASIARELGQEAQAKRWDGRADEMSARVNALLWDEESGFYYDRNAGGLHRFKSNAGFLPLFAGIADATQAAQLVEHLAAPQEFWSPLPVPTVALDEPAHEPDMWRGPTWININNLIRIGLERYGYDELSREIRRRTLDEIARWYETAGCLFEYYDCQAQTAPYLLDRKGAPGAKGGTGFGVIADYNWTAAWTLLMLLED
jgi:hypothetical protein